MRIERRKYHRYPLSVELRLEATSGRSEVRLSDLSFGGCFIDGIGQFSLGEKISFEINSPTYNWTPFRGTVAFVQPGFGFGVSFTLLNAHQELVIAQMVRSSSPNAVVPAQLRSYAA